MWGQRGELVGAGLGGLRASDAGNEAGRRSGGWVLAGVLGGEDASYYGFSEGSLGCVSGERSGGEWRMEGD